jgi:hypothetical protein
MQTVRVPDDRGGGHLWVRGHESRDRDLQRLPLAARELPVHEECETQMFGIVDHAGEPGDAVDAARLRPQDPL